MMSTRTILGGFCAVALGCGSGATSASPDDDDDRLPPLTTHPHEPAGMTVETDTAWDHGVPPNYQPVNEDGWGWEYSRDNFSIIQPFAADPDNNVLRLTYPQGMGGGGAPGTLYNPLEEAAGEIYVHLRLRWSPDWDDNGNAGTKMFFLNSVGENACNIFFNLTPSFGAQIESNVDGSLGRDMYVGGAIDTGEWVDWEILLVANTGDEANGRLQWWEQGELRLDLADVRFFRDAMDHRFELINYSPTYGGGTNPVPLDQHLDVDHWYVSRR